MQVWELQFTESENDEQIVGVYGISLVEDPAIGLQAISFNSDEKLVKWKLSSQDKQVLVSPILIPDQMIYREDVFGDEGYVYVTAETIEKLQQTYFQKGYSHNHSLEHNDQHINGIYVIESWIIEDPNNDKSNALGFKDLPKGTWMTTIKIDDPIIWEEYIKTGKVKGMSIDAFLLPVKSQNKINFNKNKMKKELFKSMFTKAVKKIMFAEDRKEFKISDELSVYADSDELTVGVEVFKADGEKMVESEFDYEGKLYKVNAEGKIETIEEINADDPQMNFEFSDEEVEAMVEEIKEEIIVDYESEVSDLKARIVELEAKLAIYETAEIEAVELRKQRPASKGVVTKLSNQAPAKGVLGAIKKHLK